MRDTVLDKFVKPSFDELMWELLLDLNNKPDFICSPRGSGVKEILLPRIVLTDPRNRLITSKTRQANYGFGVGEFLWYYRGSESLEEMLYYNKRMKRFSDDGNTLNSAYGARMYETIGAAYDESKKTTHSQWTVCVETLIKDKDSRRALMLINRPKDQLYAIAGVGSKDVPCTLSLQFFIRENRLHLHVHMRSNDVMWGLTYDLFSFTLFQELMLLELQKTYPDLKMGRYFHTAGSMHLYENHFELSHDMCEEYRMSLPAPMFSQKFSNTDSMDPLTDLYDIDILVEQERLLRQNKISAIDVSRIDNGTIRWMAERLNEHRKKRNVDGL